MFKPRRCQAFSKLSDCLDMDDAVHKMGSVFQLVATNEDHLDNEDENAQLVAKLLRENRMLYSFLVLVTSASFFFFARVRRPVVSVLV